MASDINQIHIYCKNVFLDSNKFKILQKKKIMALDINQILSY